jgi:hypothetical protein
MTAIMRKVGEACYGSLWQSELARALDVSDRSVRRWIAESPPEDLGPKLRDVIDSKIEALRKVRRELAAK